MKRHWLQTGVPSGAILAICLAWSLAEPSVHAGDSQAPDGNVESKKVVYVRARIPDVPLPPTTGKTVKFPISERTVQETIGTIKYRLLVKENTVVRIDPSGKKCPLYQRDHYRENQVHWRSVKRFVADEVVEY